MTAFSVLSFLNLVYTKFCLVFLAVFFTLTYIFKHKSPKQFPPGPWSLPYVISYCLKLSSKMIYCISYSGTMVLATLMSVLFYESEWETPHTFNPGHFLDAEGNFRRRDAFMPFSAGKRACPGEQLARMELFLFFTSLLQRFTFSPPPGVEPTLEYRMGFTRSPQPFRLCAAPR